MSKHDPSTMKLTEAKSRVLLAMLEADENGMDQGHAAFEVDRNSVCYSSLQHYGMVEPPGVLTEAGRALAVEIRDARAAAKRPGPMF